MSRIGESVDRSGIGKVVEVYPAAALCRWGFESRGYKRAKGEDRRAALVKAFLSRTDRVATDGPSARRVPTRLSGISSGIFNEHESV